jgi:hypothetical protein
MVGVRLVATFVVALFLSASPFAFEGTQTDTRIVPGAGQIEIEFGYAKTFDPSVCMPSGIGNRLAAPFHIFAIIRRNNLDNDVMMKQEFIHLFNNGKYETSVRSDPWLAGLTEFCPSVPFRLATPGSSKLLINGTEVARWIHR